MSRIPPGMGALFSRRTKRKLVLAIAGSVGVATAEVVGIAAVLPLMQLLTGSSTNSGILGWMATRMGSPSDLELATVLASCVFAAFLVKGLLTIAFRWWLLGFINTQESETATALLRQYLEAPYWLHLQRNSAGLVRTMNDAVSQTYSNVVVGIISALSELATIAGVCLVLLALMPVPAVGAMLYFAVAGYAFEVLVRRRASAAGERLLSTAGAAYQAAFQALGGVKEIKVRRRAAHFVGEYAAARDEFAVAKRTTSFIGELPRYVLELIFIVGVAGMTIGVFSFSNSNDALTMLALFVAAGFRLLPSLVRLVGSLNAMRMGRPGLDLVLADFVGLPGAGENFAQGAPLPLRERIRFENVGFGYPGAEVVVLDGVTFDVPAGTSLAVVGGSGAGKSTLVDLLLGLHPPDKGRILVDGTDIATSIPGWQRTIGLVPQDVYLLDDTLRANVSFGENPSQIDGPRLDEAVKLAQLDELIAGMPEGLDSVVGERGARLSGGQRQRIGIARALYLRPQVLVLDEATSALDNETERRITETIEALHGRMTIVVVAHRLSTVRNCDQLVFLENGRVEAIGAFEHVRESNSAFARLVELGSLTAESP